MADNEKQMNKYGIMLADLLAERAKIDAAIAAIQPLAGVEGIGDLSAQVPGGSSPAKSADLPSKVEFDTFFSLSIPEAIKKFLAMMKRPQTVTAITEALRVGGLSTTAEDLMGTITATLTRMRRTTGEVVPVRRGEWGLKEWYPGRRFDQPETKKSKPKKRAAVKGKKKQPKATQKPQSKAPESASADSAVKANGQKPAESWKPTPEQVTQIIALHGTGKKPGEIAKETGVAAMVVGRIVKKAERPAA